MKGFEDFKKSLSDETLKSITDKSFLKAREIIDLSDNNGDFTKILAFSNVVAELSTIEILELYHSWVKS